MLQRMCPHQIWKGLKIIQCYYRATHKVFESFHVVFIESKDDHEAPFRPGVVQGLNNEPTQQPEPPLAPKDTTVTSTPNPNAGVPTTSTVTTDPMPPTPLMPPPITQHVPSAHVR